MIIYWILAFISFVACVGFATCIGEAATYREKKKMVKFSIVVAILFVVCVASVTIASASTIVAVGSADKVATYVDEDTTDIYQDAQTGEYFYVAQDLWNPTKSAYRVRLNSDEVEQYIEGYQSFVEMNLLGGK